MSVKRMLAFAALSAILLFPIAAAGYGGFDVAAIYADGTKLYQSPEEPSDSDAVTIKLRTGAGNVAQVFLHLENSTSSQTTSSTASSSSSSVMPMVKLATKRGFDYYFAELAPSPQPTSYYFELRRPGFTLFYGRQGLDQKAPDQSYRFKVIPNFKVPAWMKGAVLYQIFVDRFANGDPSNDVVSNEYVYDGRPAVKVEDWNRLPDASTPYASGGNRTREFFGGDLEGVIQKLGYLKELGVEGIYLNPIFVSPSNHKYDTQDYEHVDPHFGVIAKDGGELVGPSGSNRDATKYRIRTTDPANLTASDAKFKELVDKAHALGIKVILDGVFNHSGSFNKWFNREGVYPADQDIGAYESKASPFGSYYSFAKDAWPNNESYEAWAGIKTLPKLNYEGSPELERAILGIGAKWVGPGFGADGWRLDVATELGHTQKYNHRFWSLFRRAVKTANPEATILAEVYGDASSWLSGGEWDTVMNYDAFFEPVGWYLTGLEKHSFSFSSKLYDDTRAFASSLRTKMAKLPFNSLLAAMNELDNHDHSRFLTRTSGFVDGKRSSDDVSPQDQAGVGVNKGILKEATMLQMCMPGAPTIYYGDEAGLVGFTDPDDRRTYPWGKEDAELLGFFKDAIAVHKEYSALRTGSFAILSSGSAGLFAAGRWDAASRAVVAINNTATPERLDIPVEALGMADGDSLTLVLAVDGAADGTADRDEHGKPGTSVRVTEGTVTVSLPAFGGVILASKLGPDAGAAEPPAVVTARPVLKAVSPATGRDARPSAPSATIAMTFSEPMIQRDIAAAFSIAPAVAGRFVWNANTATFVPASPLPPGDYAVSVSGAIRAVRGGFSMGAPMSWSFTVK